MIPYITREDFVVTFGFWMLGATKAENERQVAAFNERLREHGSAVLPAGFEVGQVYFVPSADLSDNAPANIGADSGPPVVVRDRAESRRQIDRLLAADRGPFATARRAAVVASAECADGHPLEIDAGGVTDLLARLTRYEEARGGWTQPSAWALHLARVMPIDDDVCAAYERARGEK